MCKKKNNNYLMEQYQPYLANMGDSALKTYIICRVIDQIKWYDKKSAQKQNQYKRFTIASVILNAIIPIMLLLTDNDTLFKVIVACLSATSGAISAIIALCDCKDLWVQYRSNCEMLKSVLHQFFLKAGEFANISTDESVLTNTLVGACEDYLTKEFQQWTIVTSKEKQDKQCQT